MGQYSASVSRNMFDESKRYVETVVQQGIPWIDADENDRSKMIRSYIQRVIGKLIGDASPDNGFKIVGTGATNDFTITGGSGGIEGAGRIWVGGLPCSLITDEAYVQSTLVETKQVSTGLTATILTDTAANFTHGGADDNLVGRILVPNIVDGSGFTIIANTQTTITVTGDMTTVATLGQKYRINLSTPSGGDRTDEVYLDVYLDEIDATEDSDLLHPLASGIEAQRRMKVVQNVVVAEGLTTPVDYVDADGHQHYTLKIATLSRLDANATITVGMVVDERPFITSTLYDIANEVMTARGTESSLTDRLDQSLNPDGTLKPAAAFGGAIDREEIDILRPHESDPVDDKVTVEAGRYVIGTGLASFDFAGGQSPAFTPVTAASRIDLLTIDDSGVLGIVVGIQQAIPVPPSYPTDKQVIAEVTIDETVTVLVTDADIKDTRYLMSSAGAGAAAGVDTLQRNARNLLDNGGFEDWDRGDLNDNLSEVPVLRGWRKNIGGSVWTQLLMTKETTEVHGAGTSLKFDGIRTSGVVDILQFIQNPQEYSGKSISASLWVKTSVASACRIRLQAGGTSVSPYHTGGGGWEKLEVTHTVPVTPGTIIVYIEFAATGVVYVDEAMVNVGTGVLDYVPTKVDIMQEILKQNVTNILANGGMESWSGGELFVDPPTNKEVADHWNFVKGGTPTVSVSKETGAGNIDNGGASLKIGITAIGGSTATYLSQVIANPKNYANKKITLSARVKTTVANVRMRISGTALVQYSQYHSGSGNFETLTTTGTMGASPSSLEILIGIINEAVTVGDIYVDSVMLTIGEEAIPFNPFDRLSQSLMTDALAMNVKNILPNGDMELWNNGVSFINPANGSYVADFWQVEKSGSHTHNVTREATEKEDGSYSMKVEVTSAAAGLLRFNNLPDDRNLVGIGDYYTATARVKCNQANAIKIVVYDGSVEVASQWHPGDGSWQTLTATQVRGTDNRVYIELDPSIAATAYIDNVMYSRGKQSIAFNPTPFDPLMDSLNQNVPNVIHNGGFESASLGTEFINPDGDIMTLDHWKADTNGSTPPTFTVKQTASTDGHGAYSCEIDVTNVGVGADTVHISQRVKDFIKFRNKTLTFSASVRTSTAGIARLGVYNGSVWTYSNYHSGSGNWEKLSVTVTINAAAADNIVIIGQVQPAGGLQVAKIDVDSVMGTIGKQAVPYRPDMIRPELDLLLNNSRFNILQNGGFEFWPKGPGPFVNPANGFFHAARWSMETTVTPTYTISREISDDDGPSQAACKIDITGGSGAGTFRLMQNPEGRGERYAGSVAFTMRVKCNIADSVRLVLYTGAGGSWFSQFHPGDNQWHTLSIVGNWPANQDNRVWVDIDPTRVQTCLFDNAMLVRGDRVAAFTPEPEFLDRVNSGLGGKVIQVLQYKNQAILNSASTSFVATSLTGTISLSNPGNRVRARVHAVLGSSDGLEVFATIYRGSTDLASGVGAGLINMIFPSGSAHQVPASMEVEDAPGSEGPHTYTVYVRTDSAAHNVTWGRTSGTQVLVLEEIQV